LRQPASTNELCLIHHLIDDSAIEYAMSLRRE